MTIGSQITGNGGFTKSGTGALALSNPANNYTGGTYFNEGILTASAVGALGDNVAGNTITIGSKAVQLQFNASGTYNQDITVTGPTIGFSGQGLIQAIGSANVVLAGTINIGGPVTAGSTFANNGSGTMTFAGPINAPAGVTIGHRLGTITYSGGGNYTLFNFLAGTALLGADNGLSTNAIIDFNIGGGSELLDLNGKNQTLAGIKVGGTAIATISNTSATPSTLTLNVANNVSLNYGATTAGVITGNLNVTKSGLGTQILPGVLSNTGGVTLNAGTLSLTASNTYTGTTTINGGRLVMGNADAIGQQAQPNPLVMAGGTLDSNGIAAINLASLSGIGGLITDSGAAAGTTTLNTSSSTNELYAGTITDGAVRALSYVKSGSGTQTLTGNSTYTGVTVVDAGTLYMNGTLTSSAVTVNTGGKFGGTSSNIGGGVTVNTGGTLAAGNSIGTLGLASVDLNGLLEVEYNTSFIDLINVAGLLNLGANSAVSFVNLGGALDGVNNYVFASYGSLTGTFSAGAAPAGYTIDYAYNNGVSSNNIALVIPEPSSLLLGGLGALALLRRRRSA
jgi:autotransporter-associated beta strand protein